MTLDNETLFSCIKTYMCVIQLIKLAEFCFVFSYSDDKLEEFEGNNKYTVGFRVLESK